MDERFRWLLVAVGAGLLCLAPGCSQDSKPASVSAGTDVASATLGPEGGELTSKDGRLLVHVPPGALSAPLTLSVAPAASSPTGALGPAYDLMPHGTRFNVPIGIRIANDIAVGSDETVGIVTVIDGKGRSRSLWPRPERDRHLRKHPSLLDVLDEAGVQDDRRVRLDAAQARPNRPVPV